MSSLSPSAFVRAATRGEPIIPPVRVSGFQPGDLPGSYRTYDSGYYEVDDDKYGPVGSIHLRPRYESTNPWSIPVGVGVLLENYQYLNKYKIDLAITSSASGSFVLRGEFMGAKVIKDYYGNRTFSYWQNVDVHLEFIVGGTGGITPNDINVAFPYGTFQRPASGSMDIGDVVVSGGTRKSLQWTGSALPTRVTPTGWTVSVSSSTPLGTYQIESVTVTAGGQDYALKTTSSIEIISGSSYPVVPTPDPEPDPVPVPVIVDVWGVQKSITETVALGDEDGQVQWVSETTTEATGEVRTEAEILPSRTITDLLPVPKILRPIETKQIKRTSEISDPVSVEEFGRREKRVRFSGVDSWGAMQQFAEQSLTDAARCVEGIITISCNPLIRAGDEILYNGHTWRVERATHSFADWTTLLTARRILTFEEVGGIFVGSTDSPEKAIVRIIKDATGRVDNAVEGVITERIDSRRYKVRVVGAEEEIEVLADHVIFGDLLVGSSVLIGRGTI